MKTHGPGKDSSTGCNKINWKCCCEVSVHRSKGKISTFDFESFFDT